MDGKWSRWSPWLPCSHTRLANHGDQCLCRVRSCDNPRPAFKGRECDGHSIEVSNCTGISSAIGRKVKLTCPLWRKRGEVLIFHFSAPFNLQWVALLVLDTAPGHLRTCPLLPSSHDYQFCYATHLQRQDKGYINIQIHAYQYMRDKKTEGDCPVMFCINSYTLMFFLLFLLQIILHYSQLNMYVVSASYVHCTFYHKFSFSLCLYY